MTKKLKQLETLSPRWLSYCAEFAASLDMQKARDKSGLSVTMVKQHANDPIVLQQITNNMQTITAVACVDKAKVLNKLDQFCESDIADIYDHNGQIKPLLQWPKIMRQQIVHLDTDPETGAIVKVKFIDKLKVIALLGKHVDVGAFEEKLTVKHELSEQLARKMQAARRRLKTIEGEIIDNAESLPPVN